MEDNISNPLRFETNPYHNVIIKDRKVMELTGVKQIDSFDSSEFLLETAQGWMVIQGKDLTLGKLDTERGDVVIRGVIEALSYVSNKKGNGFCLHPLCFLDCTRSMAVLRISISSVFLFLVLLFILHGISAYFCSSLQRYADCCIRLK